ncbi:thermonuclease family protein [Microbacterium sp. W1N]|uniref:thermonuclease family protein n=1 Tax=Microbacterium festucae TaxID=2977531 RepID=UPI0021BFD10D|nr:thermonuclease family protein [Microbacterium festucae]MCT9821139.1 thermonuclease family protein [Microbacterium festucae]
MPVWAWILIALVVLVVGVILSPVFALVSFAVVITGIVALARGGRTWLRFRSRTAAAWVTAAAAMMLLVTGSISGAILSRSPDADAVAFAAASPSPTAEATERSIPTATPTPTPTPTPTESPATLVRVVDGDTIETSAGTVRLIGIDTPEQGAWGYAEGTAELTQFLSAGALTLVAVPGRDDVDQYGRLLRYVRVNGHDAGLHLIDTGWAVARYDGRDGYGQHPQQAEYVSLDAAREMPAEPAPEPAPVAPAPPQPAEPAPAPAQPAPAAPTNDPQFGTCREANAAGYGDYQAGVDPEYNWYRDRDGDGWVCER